MREIKFRAWHVENKEIHTMQDLWRLEIGDLSWRHEEGEIVLMQYTGIKDKNGIEIYEGDIVEQQHHVKTGGILEPLFKSTELVEDIREKFFMGEREWADVTVIGNRYENLKLLEDEA